MSGQSMGRRRRRVYERKFDWAEARRRYAAGDPGYLIAKSMGVNKNAVHRVLKMSEHEVRQATEEDMARLADLRQHQDYCPRCTRPKAKKSALCRDCFNESRLAAKLTLEHIPGEKRVMLAGVASGRIVRVRDRWGVVVQTFARRWRPAVLVDFWDGGREYVPDTTLVETAPSRRVLLDGIEEPSEEIAA